MQRLVHLVGAGVAAISIAVAWTAASAEPAVQTVASAAPVPDATTQNPWVALSVMTGSSASSGAFNQGERAEMAAIGWPHAVPLTVILATFAMDIYILLEDDNSGPEPISPA
jgi:hypothetical protein